MRVDIHTLRPGESLPPELADSWRALRAEGGDGRFASPYFSHRYAEAVAEVSPAPVHVALQRPRWGEPRALLAFQGRSQARPAGAPMSDYNGPVGDPEGGLPDMLREAGLGAFQSGGLVAEADVPREPVCRIDLRGGHGAWAGSRDGSYRRHLKGLRRRVRRAAEEAGEPWAAFRSRSEGDLELLIRWKRLQFASTGRFDVLDGWPRDLLRLLWERHDEPLRAELHALRLGDRPAAFDLGLTDGEVFHSWITAYDPELSAYAPGMQLLERLVEAAPDLGYRTVDLGVGLEGYKRHYGNVDAGVGVGVVHAAAGAHAAAARFYSGAEARLEPLARLRRRYSQIAAVEPRWTGRAKALGQAFVGEAVGRN